MIKSIENGRVHGMWAILKKSCSQSDDLWAVTMRMFLFVVLAGASVVGIDKLYGYFTSGNRYTSDLWLGIALSVLAILIYIWRVWAGPMYRLSDDSAQPKITRAGYIAEFLDHIVMSLEALRREVQFEVKFDENAIQSLSKIQGWVLFVVKSEDLDQTLGKLVSDNDKLRQKTEDLVTALAHFRKAWETALTEFRAEVLKPSGESIELQHQKAARSLRDKLMQACDDAINIFQEGVSLALCLRPFDHSNISSNMTIAPTDIKRYNDAIKDAEEALGEKGLTPEKWATELCIRSRELHMLAKVEFLRNDSLHIQWLYRIDRLLEKFVETISKIVANSGNGCDTNTSIYYGNVSQRRKLVGRLLKDVLPMQANISRAKLFNSSEFTSMAWRRSSDRSIAKMS